MNKNTICKFYTSILYIALTLSVGAFVYFTVVPQYYYRDHEGYFAGMVILQGYVSLVILNSSIKRVLREKKQFKYCYIFSVLNVIGLAVCVRELLFYKARVYVISLALFLFIHILYVIYRFMCNARAKSVKISFVSALSFAGIISIASTVVRGMYFIRFPFILVLLLYISIVGYEYIVGRKNSYLIEFFPYDFPGYFSEIKRDFKKKFLISLAVLVSLSIAYFILGPLEIYAANMLSFSFGYMTFLPVFLVISLVLCLGGSAILSLLTEDVFRLTITVMTAYSVMSYIQYMFMNTKLMEEDGARLRLDTMGNYPTVNLIVWIVLSIIFIALIYIAKEHWEKVCVYASLFLAAIQFTAVITLLVKCINSPAPRYYQLTGEKQFTVATDENVIVLVPDTFSRGKLELLTEYDPSYLDVFKDFTYYNNMDSEYHATFPSFTHILTDYDCPKGMESGLSEERVEWQSDAWNSEKCISFYDCIRNSGYKFYVNIIDPCELMGNYEDVVDKVENAEYAESNVDKVKLTKMLTSMSLYRCVPYVFKPPFEYFSWDFSELETYVHKKGAYKNEDFYSEVKKGVTIDNSTDKKIHFINWHGFHSGNTNDEYCNFAPEGTTTELQNARGVMLCIQTYLDNLKDINMYDSSTIIIMGDHGKVSDTTNGSEVAVFIKLPGESHNEVIINSESGTYSQIMPTLLDMIGADYGEYGESLLE